MSTLINQPSFAQVSLKRIQFPSQASPRRRVHPSRRPLLEAAGDFLADCRARNLSARTLEQYEWALRSFMSSAVGDLVVDDLHAGSARGWVIHLQATRKPASVRSAVRALKVFAGWLVREQYTREDLLGNVRLPRAPRPLIVPMSAEHVAAIRSFGSPVLRVAVAILADTGLRSSELCGLRVEDVHDGFLQVTGKGGRERLVPFGETVTAEINRYVARGRRTPIRHSDEHLLLGRSGVPLTPHRLGELMRKAGRELDIQGVRVSPHTLRHTFAIEFLRNGGGELALQKALGHSSLDMVKVYAELTEVDVAAAHAAASPLDRWRSTASARYPTRRRGSPRWSSRRSSGDSSVW